jgi:hypothetical protein
MTEIGKKYADALLQRDTTIVIGGIEYNVPAPTYATLIRLSSYINEAELEEGDNINIAGLISLAKDESAAPYALATLILGAKECDLPHGEEKNSGWFKNTFKCRKKAKNSQETKFEHLSNYFLNEVAVSDIVTALNDILTNRLDLVFFYRGITILKGMNQTKQTKETSQIQSGDLSMP